MFALIVQTVLLMAIAFILGCILGCLLHRLFGTAEAEEPVQVKKAEPAATTAGAAKKVSAAPGPVPTASREPEKKPEPAPLAAPLMSPKPPETSAPVEKPKMAPVRKPAGDPDNLKLIRGIGPQNEGRLNALGVIRFSQIAAWTAKEQSDYGEALAFPGRIEREDWVGQAKVLAKGGATEFAKRVRSGDVSSSVGEPEKGDVGRKPRGLLKQPRDGKADNLTLIDGVGNAIEKKMFSLGVHHFDQIASMSQPELVWLGMSVGFPGRPERENWAGEARTLAAGGTTDHAKRVERGQIKSSRKSDS